MPFNKIQGVFKATWPTPVSDPARKYCTLENVTNFYSLTFYNQDFESSIIIFGGAFRTRV